MIGILLVSHATMCEGVFESCKMIIGARENIETLAFLEEGVGVFREKLMHKLSIMEDLYEAIVIVSDIPNATPYNEAYRYVLAGEKSNIHVVSGMNLAMVIELAIYSTTNIKVTQLIDQIIETGKISIT